MYFPYFRGKQHERSAIRETALLMARNDFVPIIEPVNGTLTKFDRTINCVLESNGKIIFIVNPKHGDYINKYDEILDYLEEKYSNSNNLYCGIILSVDTDIDTISHVMRRASKWEIAFIHYDYSNYKYLQKEYGRHLSTSMQVFIDGSCSDLYMQNIIGNLNCIVKDGFCRRSRNKDHPGNEFFSDLHLTYPRKNMQAFGDFLIVGDVFSEGGGPAYAVAIHVTYLDPEQDNIMFIRHFLSDSQDTPTDPAGKFAEALDKLIFELERPDSKIFQTEAMNEFRELHRQGHFPGLGVVKKLSMKHHIETLARYFEEK